MLHDRIVAVLVKIPSTFYASLLYRLDLALYVAVLAQDCTEKTYAAT